MFSFPWQSVKMKTRTGAQHAFALNLYYKTARHLCRCNFAIHRNDPVPLVHAIKAQMKYFEATGSALAKKPLGRTRCVCTVIALKAVPGVLPVVTLRHSAYLALQASEFIRTKFPSV